MNPPPSIWVPVNGWVEVLLPYQAGKPAANPQWLHRVLGSRIQVRKGEAGSWRVARAHADELLELCRERFGRGNTTVITDAAAQLKCGPACQGGNPNNALNCQCQCGGENHGGVAGNWVLRDSFAIRTDHTRRIFSV